MYRLSVLGSLFLCLCPISSKGATIFDALEPHCCAGENIGLYPGASLRHAIGFQPTMLYELTSVSFNLIGSSGSTGTFVVEIFNDNGSTFHAPGTLLASYTVPFPTAVDPSPFPSFIFEAPAPAGILLQPGQIYWIAPWASEPGAWALWWYNLDVIGFRAAQLLAGGSWFSSCGATNDCALLATRVEGTAVPEPATVVPLAAGLAAWFLRRRLSR